MRFILTILIFNTLVACKQSGSNDPCHAYLELDTLTNLGVAKVVEKLPTVDGGTQALLVEVAKKIKYKRNDKYPIETKVIVAFVVDIDGQIKGKRIIKNIQGTDVAEQLLEIVDDFKWQPATCDGKAIPMLHIFPMIIDLES